MEKWSRTNYHPCLPLGPDGKRATACEEHISLARRIAGESIVLLKNSDQVLPIKQGQRIAVFGKGQYDYVRGGGGSSTVHAAYVRNLYEGLSLKAAEGKLSLFDGLIGFYKEEVEKQYASGVLNGKTVEPEVPAELLEKAKAFTDTAIISICRFSSEAYDRKGEPHDGDFYLSEAEEKMVQTVTANFPHVIVVINAGAQTDTEWYHANDAVDAAVYAWQLGMEGGSAIADVLCGDVNPSGKLVDTFAKRFCDYPSAESFAESDDYVKYYEDIYVGYRYFETVPGACKRVNYPFGYGLSYTEFAFSNVQACHCGEKIRITVDVRNIGSVNGREVVQVYYSAPQGKLGKPARELAAFAKTKALKPGEAETVSLEFAVKDMASYDDMGKICKSAYILEAGDYSFHVGNSVRNTVKADFEFTVSTDVVTQQLTQRCAPVRLEKRMLADGSFEKLAPQSNNRFQNAYEDICVPPPAEKAMLKDVAEGKISLDAFIAQLSDEDLVSLTYGKPNQGVANTDGFGGLKAYGVPSIMTVDGPAGLRISPKTGIYTTSFPCATAIACTWNTDLMYQFGVAGAQEVKENNLSIWLTPAINIHRNPLCGRNFEYLSEDPIVAGRMAIAKVKGIQSQGVGASVKHFCVNNKETNRKESDSILSERALREIYLRAFEMCVREAQPWTVMSAYNIVNGVRASENHDSITGILRGEWGFEGMVTSDWDNTAEHYKEIKAGNDVRMPSGAGQPDRVLAALQEGKVTRAELQQCAKRVLELILKIN